MASFYKTATAVCLFALHGLQSEASNQTTTYKFKAIDVDKGKDILVVHSHLPLALPTFFLVKPSTKPTWRSIEVATGDSLVSSLKKKVESEEDVKEQAAEADDSCSKLMEKSVFTDIFHHNFDYQPTPNYRELLQAALDKGLDVFKAKGYQSNWEEIWKNADGGNLAYLLSSNSTTIACVIGQCTKETTTQQNKRSSTGDPTGKAVLFCELSPAVDKTKAPFDEEYFNGLIARTDKLASMTEEDLKAPSNDAAAASPFPAILTASMVAMLAGVSV
ncbi:SAG family member [Eimeria brunetti]|uniref:SAG family member n=1 Tax=Eimeria brunetti TaxID=51314 RepID=U6LCY6_9EIME|nr:SAG family member [Eimeria brunetti]